MALVLLAAFGLYWAGDMDTYSSYHVYMTEKGGDSGGYYFLYRETDPSHDNVLGETKKIYCAFGTYQLIKENHLYNSLQYNTHNATHKNFYQWMFPGADDLAKEEGEEINEEDT